MACTGCSAPISSSSRSRWRCSRFGRRISTARLRQIEPQADHLVSRGADLILQSGTPLALSLGPKELERLLSRLRERCGVPVLSSALNAVEAAQALGIRRLAVANKWNDTINRQLTDFLRGWDIEVVGSCRRVAGASAFSARLTCARAPSLAYQLGRRALERTDKAEALFIGGGAWFAQTLQPRGSEREFGKPVITSLNGAVRSILTALDCWRPFLRTVSDARSRTAQWTFRRMTKNTMKISILDDYHDTLRTLACFEQARRPRRYDLERPCPGR